MRICAWRHAPVTLLLIVLTAFSGIVTVHANPSDSDVTVTPSMWQQLGSRVPGADVADGPVHMQMRDFLEHLQRLANRRQSSLSARPFVAQRVVGSRLTRTLRPMLNQPGLENGNQRTVGIGSYFEPTDYQHRLYCGPGASQIAISNWTTSVPDIETVATQEGTDPNSGTLPSRMVDPINTDAQTLQKAGYNYYALAVAADQGSFNDYVAGDIYWDGRPATIGVKTMGTYGGGLIYLNGWSGAYNHSITAYGFNFTSSDNYYYFETASAISGTSLHGPQSFGANKLWALSASYSYQIW